MESTVEEFALMEKNVLNVFIKHDFKVTIFKNVNFLYILKNNNLCSCIETCFGPTTYIYLIINS